MARRMLIDTTHPEETRVVVLNANRLEEFDFETSTKKQIKGNIYLAKITRVEPSLQAAFVEYGGNRHGFLAFSEIHPDYYRIPVSDREAMLAEERAAHDADFHGEEADDHHADPRQDLEDVEAKRAEDAAFEAADEAAFHQHHEGDDEEHHAAASVAADDGLAPATQYAPPEFEGAPESEPSTEIATSIVEMHDEPVPVEIIGGDEFEEAQARSRVRHYRNYKIQEVIKRRQILLIQVTKEERGNKGAALTTYLSLAGRYCVLMPNAGRGGGVSRKITSSTDRRRLKELMEELAVPEGMGIIVRTAGSERTKAEIKRDYEYLLRLWDDIREYTLRSSAPALIYEEGSLIKRAIRDLYSRDMEEILVEGEAGYRTAKEFMRMLMPGHGARVKLYRDPTIPLLHRFQVDSQIDQIHNPVVQLRSGGYIVINPTEALVSIDVNSGRATKERNIEETATKTNLEAAEEIARQLRLRDLAGLVVIDFIDMEEGRNQKAVEARLKDAMKSDRARIQLGRISAFGLLELSRQRLRSSLIEASTLPCPHCNGTGTIRSTESTALVVLRALEDEGIRRRTAEVTIYVPTAIALYVLNQKRTALAQIEQRYGFQVTVAQDDSLIPPAYRLERVRALTPAELSASPIQTLAPLPEEEEEEEFIEETVATETSADGEAPATADTTESGEGDRSKRKRRRRKRRPVDTPEGGELRSTEGEPAKGDDTEDDASGDDEAGEPSDEAADGAAATAVPDGGTADDRGDRKRRRRGKRGGRRRRREDGLPSGEMPSESEAQPDGELASHDEVFVEEYPSVLDYARDGREHIFAEEVEVTAPPKSHNEAAGMADALAIAETVTPAMPIVESESVEAAPEAVGMVSAPKRRRSPRKKVEEAVSTAEAPAIEAVEDLSVAAPVKRRRTRKPVAEQVEAVPEVETPAVPSAVETEIVGVVEAPVIEKALEIVPSPAVESSAPPDPDRPRKTGWWKRLMQ
jgi:ribonuclease E